MAAAGVDLAFDMTAHSVIGLSEVLKNYLKFRRLFRQLFELALERQPDAIICVDFSGFNRRFAHAIRQYARARADWFHDWDPKLIQYVSPQVWASRERPRLPDGARLRPGPEHLPVREGVVCEARAAVAASSSSAIPSWTDMATAASERPARGEGRRNASTLLLLPGSRASELARHLPVMLAALELIRAKVPDLRARMVLPNANLLKQAKALGLPASLEVQVGGLPEALAEADVAIASTGTVTTECAYFGVPTVALYKTSWSTWQIAKRIVKVKYAGHAQPAGQRGSLPGIHPGRRHAGQHHPRDG